MPHHDDATTNLDAALAYAARGWRVIPIPPGRKHPGIAAWQREGTTDAARIRHWWSAAPDHGVGIVTGATSGLWVLDIDVAGDKAGDDTLAELEAAYEALPATHEVITGSGGRHLYFAWPADQEIRNSASGVLGPGIDVRGEGGQVLAPPTVHPNGQPYALEASAPDHLAPAPDWLLGLLRAAEAEPEARTPAPTGTDRPGDRWAATTTWDELLGADGWSKLRPGPDGEDRWVRPGKDAREGPSATVGYKGSDVLKVFTSSVPSLQADATYTKFFYLATTRFDGDMAAARRWCQERVGGNPGGDVRDLAGGLGGEQAAKAAPSTKPWPEPTPWPEPEPLPDFPLESLPTWAQAHAVAAADARQVPVDMCAMLAIGALAAAATGRANVWPADGWAEPVNLYLVVAMRSGAGKSPAEKAMAGWLRRWERERMAAMSKAHDEAQVLAKLADKKYRKAQDGGLMDGGDVLDLARAAQKARDEIPALPRLIIDDTTPEAVATLLAAHGERLAILSTEADLFDLLLRGNPAQRASMNVYLKAWSGDELRRDRKGGSETGPESTVLEHPLLTVSVTVQPSVLAKLLTDEEMTNRGFAARFMFSMPADLMGQRDQRRRFRAGDLATAADYEDAARDLATRWSRWARPANLHLDPGAKALFEDFLVELEPGLAVGGRHEALAEWIAKLVASVARYSGLLHLAEQGDPEEPVSEATMRRAIMLGRYWLGHAEGVQGVAEDEVQRQAQMILEWVASEGVGSIRPADLQAGMRRPGEGLDKVADYIEPLNLLIQHGWLRYEDNGDWRTNIGMRGAPSPTLFVLPSVIGNPRRARVPNEPRTASKGECFLSLSPYGSTDPLGHAVRGTRGTFPESPEIDATEQPSASSDEPAQPDPFDWSTWAADAPTSEAR